MLSKRWLQTVEDNWRLDGSVWPEQQVDDPDVIITKTIHVCPTFDPVGACLLKPSLCVYFCSPERDVLGMRTSTIQIRPQSVCRCVLHHVEPLLGSRRRPLR